MAWGPISVGGSVSGYTLPTATASVLGGVKTGSNITNSGGTISITKANVTAALGYTPPTTNTWRGIQDNLTSTATDQSLSANQGKVLKGLVDGKAASSHTHDDRYYTESEMNTKLNGKANASHEDYLAAIEAFEDNPPMADAGVSDQTRIADALEDMVALSLPDAE